MSGCICFQVNADKFSFNDGRWKTISSSLVQVEQRIKGSVSSKLYGFESLLSPLIAQACIEVCPKNTANFNVDNVRVVKVPGSGAHKSQLVRGVVIKREPEGSVRSVKKAKVAVFAQGVDTASTETKASVADCSTALQAWSDTPAQLQS